MHTALPVPASSTTSWTLGGDRPPPVAPRGSRRATDSRWPGTGMVPIRFAFLRVPLLLQLLLQALSDFPTVLYKDDPLEKVHARSKVVPSGREFFSVSMESMA